ncbi:MAG TPA: sulfatase-like hydrolase/transferase [Polyangia bacterium]|nr:sulfatase-like hydrolase/transferase [Polyangia bacterium]
MASDVQNPTSAPAPPPATGGVAPEGVPPGAWLWPLAGLGGGVIAGAGDAAAAIVRGVGGLGAGKAVWLILLASSLLALVGLAAGTLIAAAGRLITRAAPRGWQRRARPGAVAAIALPLLVYDAFALFTGHRAAAIPGRQAISLILAIGGVVLIYRGAGWLGAQVADAAGAGGDAGARRRARRTAVGLAAAAIALHLANREVLPRLYGWFHATLAVLTFVLVLVAARIYAGLLAPRTSRAAGAAGGAGVPADSARADLAVHRGRRLALAGFLVLAVGAASMWQFRRSQILRFASFERTAITGLMLHAVPLSLAPRTVAAAEREVAEADLPPLPEGPRRPDADVVLITVDALRADHVGAYGYPRATTPNLDALARTGTRFQKAYAQAPHTSFSVASMLTGKYFPTLARLAPGESHDPIATVLRHDGWRTAAFFPPAVFFVDAQKLKAYADSYFNFEYVKFEYLEAERRVDQVVAYFDSVKPQKAFVWVHFFEPHEPYQAHPQFSFGASDIDRYDSEIAYADRAIGRLVAYLRVHRPHAIIIVAADHGEEFDEHGGRYHGSTLYDEQLRVPLIINVPGVAPRTVPRPVELIDVTPTVLNLLDIPVPARMRGTDLGPWLASPPADPDRLPPAFAEVEDKRMVVWRDEKLICDLNWGFCAYYDLAADPGERRNLAEERPERAAFLRQLLDQWLDGHVRLEPLLAKGESNPEGGPVPRAIERGRLGDLLAGPELGALMTSDAPVPIRREAAQLLLALPPRKETASFLAQAARDADPIVADWAAVGAVRLGQTGARERVRAASGNPQAPRLLRIRAALALAQVGDASGVPTLNDALDHCDDVLLCRLIVINLGRLRDRRAVPALLAHLPEVQNRREMVDALGDIGDPAARDALVERLRGDEYVPVRVQAARALAKLGERSVVPALQRALAHETEATVAAALRAAVAELQAKDPPGPKL